MVRTISGGRFGVERRMGELRLERWVRDVKLTEGGEIEREAES